MEPPMSNRSIWHQNPDVDFDDTGHFLQGALCTIAAAVVAATVGRGPGERALAVWLLARDDCLTPSE